MLRININEATAAEYCFYDRRNDASECCALLILTSVHRNIVVECLHVSRN